MGGAIKQNQKRPQLIITVFCGYICSFLSNKRRVYRHNLCSSSKRSQMIIVTKLVAV